MRERIRSESITEVLNAMHTAALAGNVDAAKALVSLVLPAARHDDEAVAIQGHGSIADRARQVAEHVAGGRLSPAAGREVLEVLGRAQTIVDQAVLEARVEALEARLSGAA